MPQDNGVCFNHWLPTRLAVERQEMMGRAPAIGKTAGQPITSVGVFNILMLMTPHFRQLHVQASAGMPQMLCGEVSLIQAHYNMCPSDISVSTSEWVTDAALIAGQLAGLQFGELL